VRSPNKTNGHYNENPLANPEWIVERPYISRNGSKRNLRDLSEYLYVHLGRNDFERTLLRQIHRGMDEAIDNIRQLSNVKKWKIAALVKEVPDYIGHKMVLRKPKITLSYELTSKGNLRLRWAEKYGEESDFCFDFWDHKRSFSEPELTELIFFRNFDTLLHSTHDCGEKQSTHWSDHLRNAMLDVTLIFFEEQIRYLQTIFDVELLDRILVTRDRRDRIIDWELVSAAEVAKREADSAEADAIAEEKRREILAEAYRNEQEEAARLCLEKLEAVETKYGIPAPRLASLMTMMRDARSSMPETIRVLENQFGLVNAPSPDEFEMVGRKIKKMLRELDIKEEPPVMDRKAARDLRDRLGKTAQEDAKLKLKLTKERQARRVHFENLTGLKTERLLGIHAAYRAIGVP
jgi:hypothetical protein